MERKIVWTERASGDIEAIVRYTGVIGCGTNRRGINLIDRFRCGGG
jgi:hypothetical protein